MLVWLHRLHVFIQLLNVLCVIGDVVPADESPPWREPAANIVHQVIASNTSDAKSVSSTTSQNGILPNTQNSDAIPTLQPEVVTTVDAISSSPQTVRPTEEAEDSKLGAPKSANLVELDFGNFIDVTTKPTKYRKRVLTGGTELPECGVIEPMMNHNDSTIEDLKLLNNTDQQLAEEETAVEDLKIIGSTPQSLKVSWKRPSSALEAKYYIVESYQRSMPIRACRISNKTPVSAIEIEALEPCTNYTVKVVPKFESAMGKEHVVSGITKLKVDKKSIKLETSSIGPDSIGVSWNLPHKDCVAYYTVGVSDGEKLFDETLTYTTTFNKGELSPGRMYNFNVTIHGKNEVYGSSYITRETTALESVESEIEDCVIVKPPPPKDKVQSNEFSGNPMALYQDSEKTKDGEISVEGLSIDSQAPDSLSVRWKKPNVTVEVKDYIILWSVKKEVVHSCRLSNETFYYAITSLNPCTTYDVEVLPRLESVNGSKRVVSGSTILDVEKHLTDFKIAENSTDWLKVSWSMPNTDCVKNYRISVCDGEACTEEDNIEATTYNKTGLSPCRTYNFNLTVFGGSSVAYGSTNVTGTTGFLKPGKPAPAKTVAGNCTLMVSWPKPIGHTCVDHYRITWSHGTDLGTRDTSDTQIEIKNVKPCATYEIEINAVDINKGDGPQESMMAEMTAPAVTNAPVRINGPTATANAIAIHWLINTNETNNCAPVLMVVKCYANETLGEGYDSYDGLYEQKIHSGTKNESIRTNVHDLTPFTKYNCTSYTVNLGGCSKESDPVFAQTMEDVPSAPKLRPAAESNVTNTSITLQWEKPAILPGILRNIELSVNRTYRFHRPCWCDKTNEKLKIIAVPGNATSYFYSVEPYSRYSIRIKAATGAGWGIGSDEESYETEPGAPGEVTDLRYIQSENPKDPNILDSALTWGLPCFPNGHTIEYFHVIGNGSRDGFAPHMFTRIVNYTTDYCPNDTCALVIEDLREEHKYTIEVATKVSEYKDLGNRSNKTFKYPAGIPPQPDTNYTNIISIDPYKAKRSTSTATVLLPVFPNTGGDIACYAIIVSKIGHNNQTFARLKDNNEPHTASWIESWQQDFEIPYQALKFCRDSFPTWIIDYGRFKAVRFILGDDKEPCLEISSSREEQSYCNGPLNPDTWYHVRMRAFTAGGYRDSIAFTVKTNAELDVAIVIGTVFGILFLGILATMMLLVRKCSLQAVLRRFLHSDMPGSPVPAPFTKRKFIAHCQQLADNPGKLSNEYQLLQTLSVDLQMPTNAACLQANRKKNRYTDILPYDFSRVKLEVIDNDPNTDYINASFIKGFTGDEDYVACQGPKEETTYDFWRMIDQYDVKLIVMLTQLVEKNKEKCHQYFPTIRETFTYENMAIRCSMELDYRTYTQRTLVLQKENVKRNIIHLHFKDWPDHDVPEDFDPMINFCQIMRRHMEANRGLVVVHCSAGIGRTGTLIAIDILLQHIKDNRKLDVFGTVYRLRHHRINMVQRESQYAYIYNCIRQVLKNPYFSKTYKPPSVEAIGDNNSHNKRKEASDSSTNLVSSIETLKKSSLSTSVESADPSYQNSSKSTPKSRTCYSFTGLRCAKSTSAIDTRPYQPHIGRYNTHDHLIPDTTKDALIDYSEISLDMTESEGSTTSIYENMQPLTRSKSAQAFGRDGDACVTQKLLEHDTSL